MLTLHTFITLFGGVIISKLIMSAQQTFLVFQDVFSVTLFVFQDLLNTSSWNIFKTSCKMCSRGLDLLKTCLQDLLKTCLQDVLQLCLQDVLEEKKMFTEDVFSTSSPRRMLTGWGNCFCLVFFDWGNYYFGGVSLHRYTGLIAIFGLQETSKKVTSRF